MAGNNMSKFPVVFSISVTMTSANAMLGTPSEIYRYGTQHVIKYFGMAIGMILSSYIFIPVYFQCGTSTVYEYLEMRFGKLTRYAISAAFVIQMVLYMSSVLYSAVLALSVVTDLSFEMSVISLGVLCAFYCSMGGLKAVLWTDVFQAFLMFTCIITFCVTGIGDAGGFSRIYNVSKTGGRFIFFNFAMDLTTRYTFWNTLIRGLCLGLGSYGTSQIEVQRMLSLSDSDRAKSALQISVLPVVLLHTLLNFAGLVLYGIFYLCDPMLDTNQTGLTKYDQMIPYYIVSRLGSIPGLTGLCVAGIFSGSLSSISSALNSLATVTVVDFLKPIFSTRLDERRTVLVAKCLSALYGIICIGCALMFANVDSVKQIGNVFLGLVEGPVLAIFIIGVLTRKATDKCVLFGFLVGFSLMAWIGFGSLIGGYREPSLPLSNSLCSAVTDLQNCTVLRNCSTDTLNIQKDFSELSSLYKISFYWLTFIGTLTTLIAILVAVALTGWRREVIPPDSKCLSPITRFWMRKTKLRNSDEECSTDLKLQTFSESVLFDTELDTMGGCPISNLTVKPL